MLNQLRMNLLLFLIQPFQLPHARIMLHLFLLRQTFDIFFQRQNHVFRNLLVKYEIGVYVFRDLRLFPLHALDHEFALGSAFSAPLDLLFVLFFGIGLFVADVADVGFAGDQALVELLLELFVVEVLGFELG